MILDLINVCQYHTSSKNSSNFFHNLSFEIYVCKISNFMIGIILSQIYSICPKFSMFVEFLKLLIRLNIKLIKYI
jgi:hypothetical protein